MAQSTGDLESGLTRFLNTLYACFRFMSRFLVLCQFCECPTRGKKCKKNVSGDEDIPSEKTNRQGNRISLAVYSFPKRYILAIMTFLGFMNMYALRVNLNVAIGAMVNNHTVHQRGYTVTTEAEFDWDSKLQGIVLGSFYYGYAFLQLPGGCLALKLGGTRIFGYAIFLASMLTLLTPVATRYSVYGLIAVELEKDLCWALCFLVITLFGANGLHHWREQLLLPWQFLVVTWEPS